MKITQTKKLSLKIYQTIILVITLAVIITYISSAVCISIKNAKKAERQLIEEAEAIINIEDIEYIDKIDFKIATKYRHIIVIENGTVLYDGGDQTVGITSEAINERQEVKAAIQNGKAAKSYIKQNVFEKIVSAAVSPREGYIICISDTIDSAFRLMLYALPALLILFIFLLISFFISKATSRSISRDINAIDFDDPDKTCVYTELVPLAKRMTDHNKKTEEMFESLRIEHDKQDTMRREFTANVSHELKTPLTSISGYAEIIKNGIAKEKDIPGFAGKIYEESKRLIALVGDIIKLSQLDDKEIDVKFEDIDLYDMCSAVLSHLEMAASKRGIKLRLCGDHLIIHSAEQIIEEMIFNICDNAIKYNKENGQVDVFVRQYVDGAEVAVSDTGIGIEKDEIERIFERFYRVDKSHSKEIGGTGLGLSIVKHGAKFVGASVSVESTPGEGTTVRVLF